MDCIENAQGNRFLWLARESVLKIFELILILQCLDVPPLLLKMVNKMFRSSKPVTVQSSIVNKSIIPRQGDITASCLSQSLRLEAYSTAIESRVEEAGKIRPDNESKYLSSSKPDARLPLRASDQIVLQPPRHVQCVALPSITSNVVENEYLSHACDPAYNSEREMHSEVEKMTSDDTACHIPEHYSFINSILIDIPSATLSLSPLHGMSCILTTARYMHSTCFTCPLYVLIYVYVYHVLEVILVVNLFLQR